MRSFALFLPLFIASEAHRQSLLSRSLFDKGGDNGGGGGGVNSNGRVCDIPTDTLLAGMQQVSADYGNFSSILLEYDQDFSGRRRLQDRELAWPALAAAARALGGSLLKTLGKNSGKIADALGIVGAVIPFLVDEDAEFKNQVFERFDAIDAKLDEMDETIREGFQELKDLINQLSVNEIIQGIEVDLNALEIAYRDYINPLVVDPNQLKLYEDTFRDACLDPKSRPSAIFQLLYSYACTDCDAMVGGPATGRVEFYDTFVNKAQTFLTELEPRLAYFRGNFVTVILAYMAKAMYMEAVCLKAPPNDDGCPVEDPNTTRNLQEMEVGLVEVTDHFIATENERISECRRKKVSVMEWSATGDMDKGFLDGNAEFKILFYDNTHGFTQYWPRREAGCSCDGGMWIRNEYCQLVDSKYVSTRYSVAGCAPIVLDQPVDIGVGLLEEDSDGNDVAYISRTPEQWYEATNCAPFTFSQSSSVNGVGVLFKVLVESEFLN